MRSEMANEMTQRVVGWDLSLDRTKARMVKVLANTPTTQMMMAHIAPINDVVSLKRLFTYHINSLSLYHL